MPLRFQKSFTLFPGVRLNVGKKGVSASFGVPGVSINDLREAHEVQSDFLEPVSPIAQC